MKLAKGAYFQILNDDDRLPPDSSKLLADYLETHPDIGARFWRAWLLLMKRVYQKIVIG